MKIITLALLLCVASVAAQAPAKLFDARSGGATSTVIEFRDADAKIAVIDAFASAGGWLPNLTNGNGQPISKQQFFNRELNAYIRERVIAARRDAELKKVAVDETDLPEKP